MDIRHSIHLLTVSVCAIICLLFLVAGYTISISGTTATAPSETSLLISPTATTQGSTAPGKAVWRKAGCGGCHAKDMITDMTGPALAGVTERWSDYPREDLYAWVRNSGKLVASGHPLAVKLIKEWKTPMKANPELTDEEIVALLDYIEG